MNRILFVDDEPGILQGLRNALRRQRGRWDMVFVDSGPAALVELQRGPFHVVVSDMRMPQMDGAQLLEQVRAAYPQTARIVLSGHAEHESILRALPTAHQFLSKPCMPEQIEHVIERACSLQSLVPDEPVRRVVGGMSRLPSLQRNYDALLGAAARPDAQIADIVRIVGQDPAMCAKLLQLVNSAYFGLAQRITSIRQAVTYLGLELVKSLALSGEVFATVAPGRDAERLEGIHRRAVRTARLAQALAGDARLAEEAYAAGLLHDVGKIVAVIAAPATAPHSRATGALYSGVERNLLEAAHAQVGAYLLGIWGLPPHVVDIVALHHCPGVALTPTRVAAAVHFASAADGDAGDLDAAFLETCGVSGDLPRWRELARQPAEAPA